MYTVFDPRFAGVDCETTDYLDLVVKYGIGGVGVDNRLFEDEAKAMEVAKQVWDRNLGYSIMFTPVDFYAGNVDDEMFEKGLEEFKRNCEVAGKMKVKYCYNHVWSSNADREYDENFEWHVKRLTKVQQACIDNGINYGLEFLGPREVLFRFKNEFIHSIQGVVALADAAGGKAGFLFDTWHWFNEGAREDDLRFAMLHTDRMVGFHVNDGIFGRKYQRDLERAMPMTTGVIDSARVYKMMERSGYQGPVACEPIMPSIDKFKQMPLEDVVKEFAAAYERLAK